MRRDLPSRPASWMLPFICSLMMLAASRSIIRAQLIVAHRGASQAAPENTIAAFRQAWREGADVIEGDFHLTRDGQIVCIHDANTKRTAGANLKVADSTFAELSQLDVGRWKQAAFAGEKIPTLQQVLATVPMGKRIFIEIKGGPEIVPVLRKELANTKLSPSQIAVIAFQPEVIKASKTQLPHIKAYWLAGYKRNAASRNRGAWEPGIESVLATLNRIKADGLDSQFDPDVLTAPFVKRLRDAGMEVHCWTVDDPFVANRLRALGVDSITTNRPELIRAAMLSRDLLPFLDVHLKLDGELEDASPHHRRASFAVGDDPQANLGPPRFRPAVFGRGFDLQAKDRIPTVQHQLPSTGSICLWYYARAWYDYQTILDNSANRNAWEFWIYRTGQAKFRINPEGATVAHQFHRTGDVNEWHHLAVTWDRGNKTNQAFKLYVNGQLSDASAWKSARWTPPGEQFYLGGGQGGNTIGNGVWDDVAVFHTVLDQTEIRHIMFAGVDSVKHAAPKGGTAK